LLRIEEDSCKGHEEPLATALAPGAERPDHAPTAGDAALQGGGEEGLAGMRLEEMRVCLEVARVRRGCGNKEAGKWLRLVRAVGGPIQPLSVEHQLSDYWMQAFALSRPSAVHMAQSAEKCLAEAALLRLPQLRLLLRRHLLYSNRPPCLRLLFGDLIHDSLPVRREDLEDMGRCQGRHAALQEWKRRWVATVRALFQEPRHAYLHDLLHQHLAQFS